MKKFLLIFLILLSGSFISSQERLANSNDVGLFYEKAFPYLYDIIVEFNNGKEVEYSEELMKNIFQSFSNSRIELIGEDGAYIPDSNIYYTYKKAENSTTNLMSKLANYLEEGYVYQDVKRMKITDFEEEKMYDINLLYLIQGANEFITDPISTEHITGIMFGNFTTDGKDIFINTYYFIKMRKQEWTEEEYYKFFYFINEFFYKDDRL